MNTAQSNAAGDRRERRFTLKLLTQIGIIFGICWISTCIERVLPFTLPAATLPQGGGLFIGFLSLHRPEPDFFAGLILQIGLAL